MAMSGRKFAVFDIDGTLIRWQLYHAVADKLVTLGFIAPFKFQAIRDARMVWKRREDSESFRQYEMELVRLYKEILSEITVTQFGQAAEAVFEDYKDQVYTYTRDLIADLKKKGYLLFAISGSQAEIVAKIADYYGFDDFAAREDEYKDDRFTGKVVSPIFNKDKALMKLVKKHKADFKDSIAVGDSTSDIAMFELVENPIVFNPEKKLFDLAQNRGWKLVLERKNVIYKLELSNGRYQLVKAD